jgi:hypothetical protein
VLHTSLPPTPCAPSPRTPHDHTGALGVRSTTSGTAACCSIRQITNICHRVPYHHTMGTPPSPYATMQVLGRKERSLARLLRRYCGVLQYPTHHRCLP